jgi:GDP-L-fucose synthase
MHVDDLASAAVFLLENYDDPETINVGSGQEISIAELATLIAGIVGFQGSFDHDLSQPDGTPQKTLDSSRLHALGWKPRWDLREGIEDAYRWFVANYANLRSV